MKYAVIKTGGKQYRVQKGEVIEVEKLPQKEGERVNFDQVLLLVDGEKTLVGQPLVKKATVEGEILEHIKGPKITIAKFKAKSRYRRKKGHRQELSRVKILRIGIDT